MPASPIDRLSVHFRAIEFACHDGTPIPADCRRLVARDLCHHVLEPLRDRFGPCHVTSGYRHRRYNAAIGGANDSRHIYLPDDWRGFAADVHFARGTVAQWRDAASRALDALRWGGGVGYYPHSGFVHVDTRRSRSRW